MGSKSRNPWGTASRAWLSVQLDAATGLPTELTYNGRTWTYRYNARGLLAGRGVAAGAGRTALGVRILHRAILDRQDHPSERRRKAASSPTSTRTANSIWAAGRAPHSTCSTLRRVYDDDARLLGEWKFSHFANPGGGNDVTEVTLPSQTKVTYEYGRTRTRMRWPERGNFVSAPCMRPEAHEIEHEERQYTPTVLRAARSGRAVGSAPSGQTALSPAAGRPTQPMYGYSTSTLPYFHEFHKPVTITERGPAGGVERTTR